MKHAAGLSALALAALSTQAQAGPLSLAKLLARDDQWENDDGGNTKVTIGDKKINWGEYKPEDALDEIKDHCQSNGCNGGKLLKLDTAVKGDSEMVGATIKISVEGSFDDDGDGTLENLVDLAKETMSNSNYEKNTVEYPESAGGCSFAGGVPCDTGDTLETDEFKAIDTITIRVEGEDGDQKADMSIYVEVDVDDVGFGGCDDITTMGAGLASAFSGVLSGAFVLASLGCEN